MKIRLEYDPKNSKSDSTYRRWDAFADGEKVGFISVGSLWKGPSYGRCPPKFVPQVVRPEYGDTYGFSRNDFPTLYAAKTALARHLEENPEILKQLREQRDRETQTARTAAAYLPAADAEFYPTPAALAGRMMARVDWRRVKTVLEPSAGKGDLLDAAKKAAERVRHGCKDLDIDCVEIDQNLRYILQGKGYRVVHDDFLTYATQKRYDLILMNPPFSNGDAHLLRALELIGEGGQIVCLLNAETLRNPFTARRRQLLQELEKVGASIQYIRGAFRDGERKTEVDVALISARLPEARHSSWIWENMKRAAQQQEEQKTQNVEVLAPAGWVEAMIADYELEANVSAALLREYAALRPHILIGTDRYARPAIELHVGDRTIDSPAQALNRCLRIIRGKYWNALLDKPQLTGKLTSKMRQEYQNKLDSLADYEFSVYNIKQVLCDINYQLAEGVEQSIMALFDKLSEQHAWYPECSKNIHYFSGWATNKAHKVGKKVIIPVHGCYASTWSHDTLDRYTCYNILSDLERALNYLDRGETPPLDLGNAIERANENKQTKNIQCKYFSVTFYKKGTVHITFHSQRLVDCLNIYAARKRGWLPPSYGKKTYAAMDAEEQKVIDEFQGAADYEKVMHDSGYFLSDVSQMAALPAAV